jgi:very-short-patch-repair endonuclease
MRRQIDTDREIAAIAGRQYGVVGRSQLLALSLSAPSVDRRVQRGRLHVVHRGVYAVGHTVLTVEGRWMAATLATGGVLSHATAAAAWDLRPSASRTVHVTVAGAARRRAGVRVHRTRTLEATTYRGIPITTPLRTIIDLATTLKGRPPPDPAPLTSGVVPLHATTHTRSELEERFLELCDNHDLPRPQTNTVIEGIEVDFVWRDQRLVVEVDGYAYHRSPTAFETDRARDATLTAAGWRVLRFTWAQITGRSGWVARAISSTLAVDPGGRDPRVSAAWSHSAMGSLGGTSSTASPSAPPGSRPPRPRLT